MKKLMLTAGLLVGIQSFAQTQLIAHRGFWKSTPETSQNSIRALQNAQNLKIYGSELDVHLSKDGVLVVNHDHDINGVVIADTRYKDLKKQVLKNGESIPTLKKYLNEGKKVKNLKLIVELKTPHSKETNLKLVQKTLDLVKSLHLESQVEYIAFSLDICKLLKQLNPNAKVQYLNGDLSPEEIKTLGIDGIDYHYSVFLEKHPTWLQEAKKLGLITNTWTVNSKEVFEKLKLQGVDFVTTDIPDVLK